jgi:hypothetical protein
MNMSPRPATYGVGKKQGGFRLLSRIHRATYFIGTEKTEERRTIYPRRKGRTNDGLISTLRQTDGRRVAVTPDT